MARWSFRRWPYQPTFPITIAGHGRVHTSTLPDSVRAHLEEVSRGHREWGLLFILDSAKRPWTLYSPAPDYTAMFAPTAHQVTLTFEVFTEKFPSWNKIRGGRCRSGSS